MAPERVFSQEEDAHQSQLTSLEVFGHMKEFNRVVELLQQNKDLLVTGVSGSGQDELVKRAVQQIGARMLTVDCIRATSGIDFLNLLLKGLYLAFEDHTRFLTQKFLNNPSAQEIFDQPQNGSGIQLLPNVDENLLWQTFELVVKLLAQMAKKSGDRVVLVLKQFCYLRSWDRQHQWEEFLRCTINQDAQVSYVTLERVAELEEFKEPKNGEKREIYELYQKAPVEVIQLKPLSNDNLTFWVRDILQQRNLRFHPDENALEIFLDSVQGHISSAEALVKRLQLLHRSKETAIIDEDCILNALDSLLEDLSVVFESLLLALPPSQLQLIECLAIEPTAKPHSKEYRNKYDLARGGTLQGALKGLQQKGLIYGAEENYQLTLPLFATWIQKTLHKHS